MGSPPIPPHARNIRLLPNLRLLFADKLKSPGGSIRTSEGNRLAKVKVYLDAGCSSQILLDDGRCIIQIKEKCSMPRVPPNFKEKCAQIARETKKQILLSGEPFRNVREGNELEI